jgi:cytochrome b6-f complex iron-sulfur subunit
MTRKEFIGTLGLGAAFALTATCLNSCTKDSNTTTASGVDFTIDLSDPTNGGLGTNGGYVVRNSVVIARTTAGALVAATVICTHEGQRQVIYDKSANGFYCNAHGARFDLNGKGLNSNGSGGLTIYKTTLTGNSLRVYS